LSGLSAAYKLYNSGEKDFLILESRDSLGGRIMPNDGIDFGATWFQTHHQNVIDLLEELEFEKFHQFNEGRSVLVYGTMAPEHYFENDPNAPSAYRVAGNSMAMIRRLAAPFADHIRKSQVVTQIKDGEELLSVQTDKQIFKAEKVLVTVPPGIATRIKYTPELPEKVSIAMEKTHTWMSNAIKVGLTFKKPFWRSKNLS